MHYVYLENKEIRSILNYEANVPETFECVTITDEEYESFNTHNPTHYFDVDTRTVQQLPTEVTNKYIIEASDMVAKQFLDSTDWQVLRHIRQKALGVPTSLTEEEYLDLEQRRSDIAASIVG